jgi:hypothetical protein
MNFASTLTAIACGTFAVVGVTGVLAAPSRTPASLETAFSNTIRSTYPDGRTAYLWLSRDGSYKAMGRRKDRSDGHWSYKGGKVCLKQAHPMAVPFSFCTGLHEGGIGTRWSAKAVSGEPIQVQVVAGREGA